MPTVSSAHGGVPFDEADALPLILEWACRRAEVFPAAILALLFRLRTTRSGSNSHSEGKPHNRNSRDYIVACSVDDEDHSIKKVLACCISARAVRREGNIVHQETGRESGDYGIGLDVDDSDRAALVPHVGAVTVRSDSYAFRGQAGRDSGNHRVARRIEHQHCVA